MNTKHFKIISILSVVVFLALCVFYPEAQSLRSNNAPINGADTAWMLTATALVLFMTLGLSFFMEEW